MIWYFLLSRLKSEIGAWLENLSFELTKVGKDMLQEAFKKLDDAAARVEKGEAFLEDSPEMKFISRTLSKTDVGYLCHGSVHPSCLTLVMTTAISKVKVGARIVLDVKGPASKVRDRSWSVSGIHSLVRKRHVERIISSSA